MTKQHKPSKPFPNGTSYHYFHDSFCCRCKKHKTDKQGLPLSDNCKIENALSIAQFDSEKYPENDIVEVNGYYHVCLHFDAEDEDVMHQYRQLFEGTEGQHGQK